MLHFPTRMARPSFLSIRLCFAICKVLFFPLSCHSLYSPNDYQRCAPFTCGNLNITFPFYSLEKTGDNPRCGLPGLELACNPSSEETQILISGQAYQVKGIYYSEESERLLTVSDDSLISDLRSGNCDSPKLQNFSSSASAPLQLVASSTNLTLVRCTRGLEVPKEFLNYSKCGEGSNDLYLVNTTDEASPVPFDVRCGRTHSPNGCKCFRIPVISATLSNESILNRLDGEGLLEALETGFPLQWPKSDECQNCLSSSGRCGYDVNLKKVVCLPRSESDSTRTKHAGRWKIIIGAIAAAAFLFLAILASLAYKFKREAASILNRDYFKSKRSRDRDRNVGEFIKSYQSTTVSKYSYSEIRKMTSNFKEKLGEGGYGSVYKGKLVDGRLIAAKMLDKSRDNPKDFINEVATIGRIHHVNVIRLFGFCWEGSKCALVYEFMPNGSLGRLISDQSIRCHLGLPKLLEIAIGIAHGIEYLHQGCDVRILHLDIKPHNVLLDHNYNPKISDFGLSKSYSRKQSAVSLTDARGTAGYIAPEVFLRNLGGVSHKSDVYSYGMLLLEMVGGPKNSELEPEYSSKSYLPNWMYDQIIQDSEMEIVDSIVEDDASSARKMIMVGMWCVQTNPADRPSISRALEMLQGQLEGIEIPPKPFLFSPPRVMSQHENFSSSSDTHDWPLMSHSG